MLFFFWFVIIDVLIDGEGGLEDENRFIFGFFYFDIVTKGKVFWIGNKFLDSF